MDLRPSSRVCFGALLILLTAPALRQEPPELRPAPEEKVPAIRWETEVRTFRSKTLEDDVRIFVARPPSFGRAERTYPVLYVLDGQHYFPEVLSCAASLAGSSQIPELVLVGVESKDRRVDYTPPGLELPDVGEKGRADRTLDFFERELVPAVEAALRGGRPRILLGHSNGGILALHAIAQRPSLFPWVLDLDTPVHLADGYLARGLERALSEKSTPPLRVVSFEVVFGWPDERWRAVEALAWPGDLLKRNRLDDESHESLVFAATYRGLKQIFADASALGTRNLSGLEIDERFRALAPLYGSEVQPPEGMMRRVIEDLLLEGYGARAGVWLDRYEKAYGPPRDEAELAKRIAESAALGEPKQTVADLLALPRATPEEMKGHLGQWEGSMWIDGEDVREEKKVRFWIDEGVVRGEILSQGPPIEVEYLRVRPDGGVEFGHRNGIRPRGLIVFEEARPGGNLEGEMNFRGIRFTPPAGEAPGKWKFELEQRSSAK